VEAEVARLRQELHRARALAERVEAKAEALETRVDLLTARVQRASSSARAASPSAPADPSDIPSGLPVVRLGGRGGPTSADGESPPGAVDAGEPPVLIRVRGQRAERLSVDREVLERPDPVLDASPSPEAAYAEALAALRESKAPKAALARFRAFLERHPEHPLAAHALYWTGESLQMLVRHEAALEVFERLLARHPDSNKVPWAMLRAAEAHRALGRAPRGRALLERLLTDHPRSEPARVARAELEAPASVDR
jgi:TolA-binding protein